MDRSTTNETRISPARARVVVKIYYVFSERDSDWLRRTWPKLWASYSARAAPCAAGAIVYTAAADLAGAFEHEVTKEMARAAAGGEILKARMPWLALDGWLLCYSDLLWGACAKDKCAALHLRQRGYLSEKTGCLQAIAALVEAWLRAQQAHDLASIWEALTEA